MDRLTVSTSRAGVAARPLALLGLLLVAAGCGGGGGERPRLLDGNLPAKAPSSLRNLHAPIATTVRTVRVGTIAARILRTCIERVGPVHLDRHALVVERVGVSGASVTFRGRPIGWVRGCDATFVPTGLNPRWCGSAVGRLRPDGTLFDPRLDIGCHDRAGRRVGFAWVDPLPQARYVALEGHGYTEIYPTAGRLPVRVTTGDVTSEGSSAALRVAQYTGDGTRLSKRTIRTQVAG